MDRHCDYFEIFSDGLFAVQLRGSRERALRAVAEASVDRDAAIAETVALIAEMEW